MRTRKHNAVRPATKVAMRASTSQRLCAPEVQLARAAHIIACAHHSQGECAAARARQRVWCDGARGERRGECAPQNVRHARQRNAAPPTRAPRMLRCAVNASTLQAQPRTTAWRPRKRQMRTAMQAPAQSATSTARTRERHTRDESSAHVRCLNVGWWRTARACETAHEDYWSIGRRTKSTALSSRAGAARCATTNGTRVRYAVATVSSSVAAGYRRQTRFGTVSNGK